MVQGFKKQMILSVVFLLVLRITSQETCPCEEYNVIEPECSKFDSSLTCKPQKEIIGGTPANIKDWPYLISFQKPLPSGCFIHFCSGVLIAPNLVLSAAHCWDDFAGTTVQEGDLRISQMVASHAPRCRHQASTFGPQDRINVAYIYLHPQWNRFTASADFAILVLGQDLPGPYIKLQPKFMAPVQTKTITIAGWGYINPEEKSEEQYNVRQLYQANVNYINDVICTFYLDSFSSNYAEKLNQTSMLCAYNESADSCSGDSGGPAVLKGETPSEDVLVGVMSWGPEGQCTSVDQGQAPTIFARVSTFKEWIDQIVLQHQNKSIIPGVTGLSYVQENNILQQP